MPDDSSNRVACRQHGSTPPTFACVHLATHGARGLGVCYDPASEATWPDLACNACARERDEREWTEAQARERVRLLCAYCWEDAFGANVDPPHPEPDTWLHDAVHRSKRRQDRWLAEYGIGHAVRYNYRLEEDPPWLGFGPFDERMTMLCDVAVIGSWSARSNTWLWGWANVQSEPRVSQPLVRVKRQGERLGIERLWRSYFAADEELAWNLAGAALDLMADFEGVYRSPHEGGSLFLAARNSRRAT
jgi:hypothetical protein